MPPDHAKILLVEDSAPLAETVGLFLENEGYIVDYAADGLSALHLGVVNRFDAIVLDIMLPGLDGFEVCKRWRQDGGITTPILMLTAKDGLDNKLQGFDAGADDYLLKPFDLPELNARLQALIRRNRGEVQEKVLQVGSLTLDMKNQRVTREGKTLRVTPIGLKVLKILMRQSPSIVLKEDLEREIWGDDPPDSDTLRSHLYQLRKAVDKPFDQPMIHTRQGVGISLSEA